MPKYSIAVPGGGTYQVDSPTELTDAQAWAAVQNQISSPPPAQSAGFSGKNIGIAALQGLAGGSQAVTDLFGAGNAASKQLGDWQQSLEEEKTLERKAEIARRNQIIEQAKKSGSTWEEIKAELGGFAEAPFETGTQALFSGAPMIAATFLAPEAAIPAAGVKLSAAARAALAARKAATSAEVIGGAMGVGSQKGQDYETVKRALMEKGMPEPEAEKKAQEAAEYSLQNLPRQAFSAATGALEGKFGIEKPLGRLGKAAKPLEGAAAAGLKEPTWGQAILRNTVGESLPEGAQAFSGQIGTNIALNQEGIPTDIFEGVPAAVVHDMAVGAVLGAGTSPAKMSEMRKEYVATELENKGKEKDRLQKEIDEFQAPESPLLLPAPPKAVTPRQEDLMPNPMGNISREELGPEVTAYIDKHRADNNLPHLQSYAIEDVKDAMTGVNPAGEQGALDAILTSKTGFSGTETYTPNDVIAAAAEKNVATETKGFNDFLTRTTGAPKLEDMSQPQLYAAFTALKQMDRPATGIQLVLPEGSNASRQQSIAPVEQPKIDLPTGHTIQQVTLQDGEKPSAYAISVQGAGKPLVTVKTQEEADTKSADIHQERQKEAARTLSEVMAHEAAIKTSADNLTKMEADGQAGTEAYAKAQAQHALKEQVFGGQIESLYNKIEGLTAPLDVKPVGMEPVTRTAHVLTKDGQTLGTYPTHVAAENSVLSQLPDDQLNSVVSDKRFGGFSDRAAQEQNRRQSAPPEGKKVSEVLGEIEEEKQKPIREKQIAEIMEKLTPILQKFGLKDMGLKIATDLGNAEGEYTQKLIQIALDATDHIGILRHEAIHALKELGFFTPQQWSVLENRAKSEWIDKYLKQRAVDGTPLQAGQQSRYEAYDKLYNGNQDIITEEAIADAFRDFDVNKAPPGMIAALLNKIKAFFSALNNAVRGAGFQTAEGVFGKVERGELTATAAEPTATAEEKPAKASIRSLSDQQREGMKSEFSEENARNKYVVENHAKALEEYNKLTPQLQKKLDAYRFAERRAGTGMSKEGKVFDKSQSKSAITKAWNAFNNEFKQHFGREMNQDEMNAHYNDPQKTINEYLGEEVPTKKASLRTGPLLRSDRNTGKFAKGENTISTRKPTSAKPTENPNTDKLNVGIGVVAEDPKLLAKHAELIKDDPLMGSFKSDSPEETINHFIEALKNNLLHLWNATPKEIRERSRNWYKGANKIANNLADQADISENAASGVLAALSPQTPWDTNVSQATRVITIWKDHQNTMADQSMSDWFDSKIKLIEKEKEGSSEAMVGIRDAVAGKTFKQLEGTGLQPWWLRAYDETHHSREYHLIAPEGKSAGLMLKKDGNPANMPWGNTGNIEKALSILNNDSIENISNQMGDAHKVRSFYNNIVNPDSPDGHVTIDTHAVAAARFEPLSGNAPEVAQAWGGQGSSSIHGQGGLYGEYAEAYRRAAEELGVLPREVQSVTWEKVRGLFPDTFKTKEAVKNVKSIWNEYKQGKLTEEQVRKQITDISPNQNPNWHGVSKQSVESAKSSPHEVEPASGAVRSGQAPSGAKRGTAKLSLRTAPNTPAFKQWFGNSKIVDKDGNPKVMYHGTARDITEFKPKQANAIFVTEDPSFANSFTSKSQDYMVIQAAKDLDKQKIKKMELLTNLVEDAIAGNRLATAENSNGMYNTTREDYVNGFMEKPTSQILGTVGIGNQLYAHLLNSLDTGMNIMPVYVKAEKIFDYQNYRHIKRIANELAYIDDDTIESIKNGDWETIESEDIRNAIELAGFDSFYVKEHGIKNLAVFNPTQIKSATGNIGTFSPTNPDIRKSLRTNTPEFKQFFGKSVTVDEDGNPKVMYHGTARDITEFRPHQAGAIFVTDNPETAERYTQQSAQWMSDHATDMLSPKQMREATATTKNLLRENGYSAKQIAALVNDKGLYKTDEFREAVSKYFGSAANILPVYVRAENPFDYENPAHVKALMERVPGLNKAGFDRVNNWTSIEGPKVQEAIKAMGFDSFYVAEHGDKNLAVYEPTQIKSAIGNEGTYSRENPDIRKSLRTNAAEMFDPEVLEKESTTKHKSREKLINMNIDDFLRLAKYTDSTDSNSSQKMINARKRVADGTKFNSLPYLSIDGDSGTLQTTGHEGRHRAKALKEAGYETMPVVLKSDIRWSEQNDPEKFDYKKDFPERIKAEKGAINENFSIPFPFTREEAGDNYLPTVRKSLRRNLQDEVEAMPGGTDILKRVYGTTTAREEKGFIGRMMEAISPESLSSLRAKALNRYNQLGVYEREIAKQMGGIERLADLNAESAALMSDTAAGVTASVLGVHDRRGGVPVYKNGYTTVDSSIEGPIEIFAPLAAMNDPFVYRLYQFYAASHRGVRLNDEGREENFTPTELAYAKSLGQKYKEFEPVRQKWLKFNDALVDYQVATGVLSKDKAAEFTKYSDYVPFYRQLDGESTVGPNIFQSLTGIKGPKKLKGSEAPLADFLETIVRNTQAAVQSGMKNTAGQKAVDAAVFLQTAEKLNHASSAPDVVTVLRDGKPVSYRCSDQEFIHAVKSLNLPELPFLSILAAPANLLRNMVTKDPGFILANMMRDSLSAYVTSGIKGNPLTHVASVTKNFGKTLVDQSPEYQQLLKAGIIGGYDFAKGIQASGESLNAALVKKTKTESGAAKLFKPATSIWGFLEKATEASDAATRIEVFKKTLAETGNEAEALFRAMEVMNFNRKGSSAVVRIATAAIPFLNARMQGLDVFYRSGIRPLIAGDATAREKEIARTFIIRGLTMMSLSVMYAAAISGDPDYEKQEQETKDNNWLIPSLGIRIPIPFEVGTLFKTIPERIYHLTTGHDTPKDFQHSMTRAITSTFGINPVPQAALPVVETMTNYSFFTGRPIIGQNMANIAPEFQSNAGTSKTAIAMGQALGMSPIKIDHIFQGYTGAMGTYASNLIDSVINVNSDNPSASKRFEQTPVLKRFLIDPQAKGKVSAYYELKDQVDTVVRTINMLQKTHDPALEQYWKDNAALYTARHYMNTLDKKMDHLNAQAAQVRAAAIPADEKRDTLLEITKAQNAFLEEIQTLKKELSIK